MKKKKLKKEISIKIEKIIICELCIKIVDKSFTGKKPPEEIIVIAKFKELNDLIPKIFKTTKINNVKKEYNKNILIACFKTSVVLNDRKFVKDFFRLSS